MSIYTKFQTHRWALSRGLTTTWSRGGFLAALMAFLGILVTRDLRGELLSQAAAPSGDDGWKKVAVAAGVIVLVGVGAFYLGRRSATSGRPEDGPTPELSPRLPGPERGPSPLRALNPPPGPGLPPAATAEEEALNLCPPYPGTDPEGFLDHLARQGAFSGRNPEELIFRKDQLELLFRHFLAPILVEDGSPDPQLATGVVYASQGSEDPLFLKVVTEPDRSVWVNVALRDYLVTPDAGTTTYYPVTPSRLLEGAVALLAEIPPGYLIVGCTAAITLVAGALAQEMLVLIRSWRAIGGGAQPAPPSRYAAPQRPPQHNPLPCFFAFSSFATHSFFSLSF